MNCFAFNKSSRQCTCLTVKGCLGFDRCCFYKSADRATAEALSSPKYNKDYWKTAQAAIKKIEKNQQ